MKKTYRVWDPCNDFETIAITTEEEIQRFARFLKELFNAEYIHYEELKGATSNTLYKAYADYLEEDGFSDCAKEISKLRAVDEFLKIY
jgi:ubiquinone biosynthesis protein Coq4